ncbi:uncharacterized protein LOC111997665 [Quercus suber]|uniref:uncharacterized protein LOC111997665 n=1 Tax=Quercus suber TaxID=58331 RepID=UPI0032E00FB0
MLMKLYFLSSGIETHLLSNNDGGELDLPFEISNQELEIILFPRSTFVLGRSSIGKTTVLTMKLFLKEKLHHKARELLYKEKEVEVTATGMKENVLHQLFVTVSPRLCFAVKQHVSHLKSFSCGGNSSKGSSSIDMDDFDDASQFKDIPDSFVDVPPLSYPLVITFHKFLIMLDGTVGNSYFERFHEARKLSNGPISGSSVSLQSFIRMKEVNYERFSTSYWPRFNRQLTKKLDSSIVFTEIISHIKGGPQVVEAGDGKLSREDYVLLSGGRVSRLCIQKREKIYEIFQNYEKMKNENGEFDFSDLVIDLHRRLRVERYEGDEMDFVYVDEVQDLTLSQIALFKYICKNVEEGFVFSGDTAQMIVKGIDFRFQDIRSLFYNKFVLESKSSGQDRRKEKGIISEIFHLSQNFRTHDGVLKLSQSVIELIYLFFPLSTDVLQPETGLIYGEAPILLESGNKENAIITIFGNSGNDRGSIVGFGAEQVILVRDDFVRKEITNHVGNQALVLTIVECKGLEFQDVLLYNFFGSSSLKNQWRVIYKYMEELDLLDPTLPISFPSFNEAKRNMLCSELKQLYVAITRARQRLWISENSEDLCKPMFDYWKKKCLVQVKQLDDSLAQAMQVTSSPEEWKSQLYFEHKFELAIKCFERAGNYYWERRSKAAGLRENADHMRGSNLGKANVMLRQVAEIFENIGKADSAAQCFSDLGEYERAVTMQAQRTAPPDMVCKDNFLIQSTIVPVGTIDEDITPSMFAKDGSKCIEENKLRVTLISPPSSPELSPINGLWKQGLASSKLKKSQELGRVETQLTVPKDIDESKLFNEKVLNLAEDMESKTVKDTELKPAKDAELKPAEDAVLKPVKHAELKPAEVTISKLTEEKSSSIQDIRVFQEKLAELSKRGVRRGQVGFPLLFVCMVAIVSVELGYLLHR